MMGDFWELIHKINLQYKRKLQRTTLLISNISIVSFLFRLLLLNHVSFCIIYFVPIRIQTTFSRLESINFKNNILDTKINLKIKKSVFSCFLNVQIENNSFYPETKTLLHNDVIRFNNSLIYFINSFGNKF